MVDGRRRVYFFDGFDYETHHEKDVIDIQVCSSKRKALFIRLQVDVGCGNPSTEAARCHVVLAQYRDAQKFKDHGYVL